MKIGEYTFKGYCDAVERFHGTAAPGVVLGGFLVEEARARLPEGVLFEALCETRVCLADAIQLLTPCTIGSGLLKVIHVGRFALTLYDKVSGEGVRAFLDARSLDPWPEIRAWFLKLKAKAEQDSGRLLEEIRQAGREVIGVQSVTVDVAALTKTKLGPVRMCAECGEAFPSSDGDYCGACRGGLPYVPPPT